jgi:outer membrane protein TolC
MAKGALLPSLNGVTSVGQQRFGEYTMDGVGNFDTNLSGNVPPERRIPVNMPDYYLGFQSSWEVAAWGKLRNRRKATTATESESIAIKNVEIFFINRSHESEANPMHGILM